MQWCHLEKGRMQEWLTLGLTAAMSVNRMLCSCGAHATWTKTVDSISKMLSVMCLKEIHRRCTHLMVYQWRPRRKSRSEMFAIAIVRTKSIWKFIVIDVRGLSDKDCPTFSEMFRNGTLLPTEINRLWTGTGSPALSHTYWRHTEFHRDQVQQWVHQIRFDQRSNGCR